jgi:hypothetical protein
MGKKGEAEEEEEEEEEAMPEDRAAGGPVYLALKCLQVSR